MSRKKRKLQSFSENPGKQNLRTPKPETWGWKESLLLAGVPVLFLAMIAGVLALDMRKDRRKIEERVERMKLEHKLTDQEFRKLLALELEFHSYQGMVSVKPPPTNLEKEAHAEAVTRLLGEESSEHSAHN